jgi:hypothetical protein
LLQQEEKKGHWKRPVEIHGFMLEIIRRNIRDHPVTYQRSSYKNSEVIERDDTEQRS